MSANRFAHTVAVESPPPETLVYLGLPYGSTNAAAEAPAAEYKPLPTQAASFDYESSTMFAPSAEEETKKEAEDLAFSEMFCAPGAAES